MSLSPQGKVEVLSTKVYIHARTLERLRDSIVSIIRKYHSDNPDKTGLGLARLAEVSGLKQDILAGIMDLLVKEGVVGRAKEQFALPGFKPIFSEKQKSLMEAVESAYQKRLFNPPAIEEAAVLAGVSQKDLQNALRMLVGQNRLVEIEKGLFFHHDAIEQAKSRISSVYSGTGKTRKREVQVYSGYNAKIRDTFARLFRPDGIDLSAGLHPVSQKRFMKKSRVC